MKSFRLFFFFLIQLQLSVVSGQDNDSIEDCILKYRQLNFLSLNSQISPLTLFMQSNGNFFLRKGHVERPENEEVIRFFFNKKGKQIKKCREKYKKSNDSLVVITINNYFSDIYYETESPYLKILIEEYSILLHGLNEPILNKFADSNILRIVFPCYNYMGNYKKHLYQKFNLVRLHLLGDKTFFVFKRAHFDQNANIIIDFEYEYHLNKKEVKQIQKIYNEIISRNNKVYFRTNLERQRLFEFKTKDNSYVFFRANSYEMKVENLSYFNGLINRLYYIIGDNFYPQIYKCQ